MPKLCPKILFLGSAVTHVSDWHLLFLFVLIFAKPGFLYNTTNTKNDTKGLNFVANLNKHLGRQPCPLKVPGYNLMLGYKRLLPSMGVVAFVVYSYSTLNY